SGPTNFDGGGDIPLALAAGDFNNDGKVDLVVANFFIDRVSILLGNGAGGFANPVSFATGSNPASVAVGDFNGDGKLDVATANFNGFSVSVLLGNGAGSLSAPV